MPAVLLKLALPNVEAFQTDHANVTVVMIGTERTGIELLIFAPWRNINTLK